jgi:ribosomal protein S30
VLLSAYGAQFDLYDIDGNNPIHSAAAANAGACCRYLATRGANPKTKNVDGQTPKLIAKERKAKDASKNIRKAEKQYAKLSKQIAGSAEGINWSIRLYDYIYEHKNRIQALFIKVDVEQTGKIGRDEFVEMLTREGFNDLIEENELNKLIISHEKTKDLIDYELFFTGKKYLNKQYLISSFEAKKKKKKKGPKAKKKGKTKIVVPICVLEDGPRMVRKKKDISICFYCCFSSNYL